MRSLLRQPEVRTSTPAAEPPAAPLWQTSAVLPCPDPRSAAAALRAELRRLLEDGPEPDWTTFTMSAPVRSTDAHGRVWFCYTATVEAAAPSLAG
jgi:hypothetical protein